MRGTLRTFRSRTVCLMSPLSPELVVRPTREGGATQPERVLLPTMLDDFNDSVLGDQISYARIEQLPGSKSPLSLPVYAWPPNPAFMMDSVIQTVLAPRKASRGRPQWLTPCHGGESQGSQIGAAGLSVQILGVRRTSVYRWKPGIWLTAPSSSLPGVSGSSGVGPTTGLCTIVLGGRAW